MSDITLSAGIRQNLLSLQQTSADLTTTQEQLATGKKVNTAFDNPQSYFTSQSLTNRANDLSALLDQIGQAQQTLNAANNGLTGLTSLLEQALSTAQQAQQATTGTVNYSSMTGTAAISADTTQVTSTSTVANAIAASGSRLRRSRRRPSMRPAFAALTVGDTLTFKLGSGAAVTATFGTSNTSSTNTFDNAAGLISVLSTGGGVSGNLSTAAAATSDGNGGVTVTSNDLTNNFARRWHQYRLRYRFHDGELSASAPADHLRRNPERDPLLRGEQRQRRRRHVHHRARIVSALNSTNSAAHSTHGKLDRWRISRSPRRWRSRCRAISARRWASAPRP